MIVLRFLALFALLTLAACQDEWPQEHRNRCALDPNPHAYKCEDYR